MIGHPRVKFPYMGEKYEGKGLKMLANVNQQVSYARMKKGRRSPTVTIVCLSFKLLNPPSLNNSIVVLLNVWYNAFDRKHTQS